MKHAPVLLWLIIILLTGCTIHTTTPNAKETVLTTNNTEIIHSTNHRTIEWSSVQPWLIDHNLRTAHCTQYDFTKDDTTQLPIHADIICKNLSFSSHHYHIPSLSLKFSLFQRKNFWIHIINDYTAPRYLSDTDTRTAFKVTQDSLFIQGYNNEKSPRAILQKKQFNNQTKEDIIQNFLQSNKTGYTLQETGTFAEHEIPHFYNIQAPIDQLYFVTYHKHEDRSVQQAGDLITETLIISSDDNKQYYYVYTIDFLWHDGLHLPPIDDIQLFVD